MVLKRPADKPLPSSLRLFFFRRTHAPLTHTPPSPPSLPPSLPQGHYYHELKRLVPVLPLGSTLLLPALAFGEGLAHVTLVIVQAPLPSAERVASTVELVSHPFPRRGGREGRMHGKVTKSLTENYILLNETGHGHEQARRGRDG